MFLKIVEGDEEHEEHRELKTQESARNSGLEWETQGSDRNFQYEQKINRGNRRKKARNRV